MLDSILVALATVTAMAVFLFVRCRQAYVEQEQTQNDLDVMTDDNVRLQRDLQRTLHERDAYVETARTYQARAGHAEDLLALQTDVVLQQAKTVRDMGISIELLVGQVEEARVRYTLTELGAEVIADE